MCVHMLALSFIFYIPKYTKINQNIPKYTKNVPKLFENIGAVDHNRLLGSATNRRVLVSMKMTTLNDHP